MIRLFVALALPDALRSELAALQMGVPGARWVPPENFHVTLRFIGEVDGGTARDIDEALAEIESGPVTVTLRGVGHFGDAARLRALYAAVEPTAELQQLRERVDGAIASAGLKGEHRRFVPHVTLARFSGRQEAGHHLAQFEASRGLYRAAPFVADSFELYSSFQSKSGSIYRVEAAYPLG